MGEKRNLVNQKEKKQFEKNITKSIINLFILEKRKKRN